MDYTTPCVETDEDLEQSLSLTEKQRSLYTLKLQEFSPLQHILDLIPLKAQRGLKTFDINFLCLDVTSELVAIGSSIGILYLYERQNGNLQKLRYQDYVGNITAVRIYESLDSLVTIGTEHGHVLVFTIPTKGSVSEPHRYDIVNVHTQPITALEWNNDGSYLFSGDQSGLVVESKLDLFQRYCRSRVILKEEWGVVQLSIQSTTLAISTLQRALLCDLTSDGVIISQIGQRERKSFGKYGVLFHSSDNLFTTRPSFRLWKVDLNGTVVETMLVKKLLEISMKNESIILLKNENETLNDRNDAILQLERLKKFLDIFILAWNNVAIYIIDPESRMVIATSQEFQGSILDVATFENEVFVLEHPRTIRRLADQPEDIPASYATGTNKDDFDFLSVFKSPFQDLLNSKDVRNNNNNNNNSNNSREEQSPGVLSWLKTLTSPSKDKTEREMQEFNVPPPVESFDLSKPLILQDKESFEQRANEIAAANGSLDALALAEPRENLVYPTVIKKKNKKKKEHAIVILEEQSDGSHSSSSSAIPQDVDQYPKPVLPKTTIELSKELPENQQIDSAQLEAERLARILQMYQTPESNVEETEMGTTTTTTTDGDETVNETIDESVSNSDITTIQTSQDESDTSNPLCIESPAFDIYSSENPPTFLYSNNSDSLPSPKAYNENDTNITEEVTPVSQTPCTDEYTPNSVLQNDDANGFNFKHSIEEWLQHKLPTENPVLNISVNSNYVYLVDSKERVFVSNLNCDVLNWNLMEFSASQIALSETSDFISLLHRSALYSSQLMKNGKPKFPLKSIASKAVSSVALSKNIAWYILSGTLKCIDVEDMSNQPLVITNQPCFPKDISSSDNVLWLSTHNGELFCFTRAAQSNSAPIDFRRVTLPVGVNQISSLTLAKNGSGWIIDQNGNVYVKTGINGSNPSGSSSWYQLEMNQFFFDAKRTKNGVPFTKNLLKERNNKSIIGSSSKGIILCHGDYLLTSRDRVSAHKWDVVKDDYFSKSVRFKWSILSAAGMSSSQDPIWAVYATGELFCFNEVNGQPFSVSAPNSDTGLITCLAPSPGNLWVLTSTGKIHLRDDISSTCIKGTRWNTLDEFQLDGVTLTHLSCSKDIVWACDTSGCVWVRVGPLSFNKSLAPAWINIDEIDDHSISMKMVSVGVEPSIVWGVNKCGVIYTRKGISPEMPIGESWEMVPGIEAQCVVTSKSAAWALTLNDQVYYRYGIDSRNVSGDAWIKLPGSFSQITVSPNNRLWTLDKEGNAFQLTSAYIEFKSLGSVHAAREISSYTPEMGEDWEVL